MHDINLELYKSLWKLLSILTEIKSTNYIIYIQTIVILFFYYYKDVFTHKDINTYINGVVKICLNKFFFENTGFQKKRERCNSFNKIQ